MSHNFWSNKILNFILLINMKYCEDKMWKWRTNLIKVTYCLTIFSFFSEKSIKIVKLKKYKSYKKLLNTFMIHELSNFEVREINKLLITFFTTTKFIYLLQKAQLAFFYLIGMIICLNLLIFSNENFICIELTYNL